MSTATAEDMVASPASRRPFAGVEWLAANGGGGRIQPEHKEDLRAVLVRDLVTRTGPQAGKSSDAIKQEVDKFLEMGRVSESNLGRLERRVVRACKVSGSAAPSDNDARSVISDFSKASQCYGSQTGSQSARGPASSIDKALMPSVPETAQPQTARELVPVGKWSEVHKMEIIKEERDKERKKMELRKQQEQMRKELKLQMEEKERRKQQIVEEEKNLVANQQADYVKWKELQAKKEEERLRKAHEEKIDREHQVELTNKQREADRVKKLEEDRKLVKLAEKELKEEARVAKERKEKDKMRQQLFAQEWNKGKSDIDAEKKAKHEEELKKVEEYKQMLAEQEARNKQPLREARGNQNMPSRLNARRGEEAYTEDAVMKQLRESNLRAEEAERKKVEALKAARLNNQEFLFQQMAERERNRRQQQEQRGSQKEQAKAAELQFEESEKRRLAEQRQRNVQYRLELEKQIHSRAGKGRSKVKGKSVEDDMSQAEKAINRHLIMEAAEMRQQLEGMQLHATSTDAGLSSSK